MRLDKKTILDKLGGEEALAAAVEIFYDRLLQEKALEKFFKGANINRLKQHQLNFMRFAFTKIPDDMDVPGLILSKHESLFKMGMDETHFDVVAEHFKATLEGLQVDSETIAEALGVIGPLRGVFAQGAAEAKKSEKKSLLCCWP